MLNTVSRTFFALMIGTFAAVTAKADTIFVGSQAGMCCFNVGLHQVTLNSVQVTVSLTNGAQYFVSTGSGNHPGFAFNLAGDPTISISNLSAPWVAGNIHFSDVVTNGPALGTFNNFIDNVGNGASAHNNGPLVFTITNVNGISASSFIANSNGYFFAADIMNAEGSTGESGINTDPRVSSVPEPGSLVLLGSGILGLAGAVRRRLQ